MFLNKWTYVALMIWFFISLLTIGEVSDDTMAIINVILFGCSMICFEIRMLREESEERG